TSQLVRTAREIPTLIATAETSSIGLPDLGCEVLELPSADGRVALPALLDEMGRRRMTNVLVEGGSGVLGAFLATRAIDEVHVFIAPKLIGGAEAKTPIEGPGVLRIS